MNPIVAVIFFFSSESLLEQQLELRWLMAVKALAKPDNLISVLGTHTTEGENQLRQAVPDLHTHSLACGITEAHVPHDLPLPHTHKCNQN